MMYITYILIGRATDKRRTGSSVSTRDGDLLNGYFFLFSSFSSSSKIHIDMPMYHQEVPLHLQFQVEGEKEAV